MQGRVCVVKGRLRPVDYLTWAQTVPAGARWNLTASGVPDACGPGSLLRDADVDRPLLGELELEDLCRRDKRAQILAEFLQTIAQRYGVAPECVVPTLGSSGAITQVLFALARPGDHVIVERPTFEPLHRVPEMLGLNVSRLERKFEERWEPLPDRLARLLTPKTRAVILSSLHNPSGVAIEQKTLAAIGEMAARVGAVVLVDEVYLDFDFARGDESTDDHFLHARARADQSARPWRPAAVVINNGVSWSSTTKCFGFSALRAGWVVTRDRDAAQAFRLAANYFHVDVPLASLALATRVMRRASELEQVAARAIEQSRAILERWLASETRVAWVPPSAGHTGLIRLPDLTSDLNFARHLRDAYDTQVVPGVLFEAPGSVRVSFNLPAAELEQALGHFSAALDDVLAGRVVS